MIGVLASGQGTNLQALLDAELPVVAVASNKHGVRALERAEAAGVAAGVFPLEDYGSREERDGALGLWLVEQGAEVAVLAGYMHLLTTPFLELFPDRIVNVHPSLLPRESGMAELLPTVRVAIFESDTIDTVRQRIQSVEHWLLPRCVSLYLEGKVWP